MTTVGYGDVVPDSRPGEIAAVLVMAFGVAALSLVTAIVTSAVVSYVSSAASPRTARGTAHSRSLERIEQRLDAIEKRL